MFVNEYYTTKIIYKLTNLFNFLISWKISKE